MPTHDWVQFSLPGFQNPSKGFIYLSILIIVSPAQNWHPSQSIPWITLVQWKTDSHSLALSLIADETGEKSIALYYRSRETLRFSIITRDKTRNSTREAIGIRDLRDVRKAFLLKKRWALATGDSIWSAFMHQKYKCLTLPTFWRGLRRCSVEWKELLKITTQFEDLYQWEIGRGDISFWFDNWNCEFNLRSHAPPIHNNHLLKVFWIDNQWDFSYVASAINLYDD